MFGRSWCGGRLLGSRDDGVHHTHGPVRRASWPALGQQLVDSSRLRRCLSIRGHTPTLLQSGCVEAEAVGRVIGAWYLVPPGKEGVLVQRPGFELARHRPPQRRLWAPLDSNQVLAVSHLSSLALFAALCEVLRGWRKMIMPWAGLLVERGCDGEPATLCRRRRRESNGV